MAAKRPILTPWQNAAQYSKKPTAHTPIGRLMHALDDSGFSDNTVVLFSSDHGDMIGERSMWFKKTLFNPAIQAPMIIAHPHYQAQRVAAPVSLLDVFST